MTSSLDTSTKLLPPWLHLARALWIILTAFTLFLFLFGTWHQLQSPLPTCTTPGADCLYWTLSREDMQVAQQMGWNPDLLFVLQWASVFLVKVAFCLLAILIFWRRSDDSVSLLLSFMLVTFTLEGIGDIGFNASLGTLIILLGGFIFFLLPFIFPNGRFVPWWTRWLCLLIPLLTFAQFLLFIALPFGVFLWFIVGAYSVWYRYRRVSTAVERQQVKWVMVGILGWAIGFILQSAVGLFYPAGQPSTGRLTMLFLWNAPLYTLSLSLIPLTIAIAILRYRLWEIDVIIRKTVVYGVLTALLALLYFSSVVLLQRLIGTLTGVEQSPLAVVGSTLVIAALFTPLRRRVQTVIDRRFFRKKFDAQQVLAQFAQIARDEVSLEVLTAELTHVLQDTMQPAQIGLWLANKEKTYK